MIYIVIFSMLISTWAIGKCYGRVSGVKAGVLGIANYFFFYILCSALLFWTDYYSLKKAIVGTAGALVLVAIAFAFCFRKKVSFFIRKREVYAILLMCILILPLTMQKFGFFGMGQDQGVYQTKAIELINGNNQRIFDFWEYETLDEQEKEIYRQKVEQIGGLDGVDFRKPGLQNLVGVTDVAGIYHGIPTFPAILAMFGKFFGLSHMQDCQTLFLFLMVMIVYYILENFRVKYWIRLLVMGILGISPEVIWVSKSALTEMFMAVIMATFVLMLTEKKEHLRFLSFLPVAVLSFYHVSVFTVMPLFVVLYWLLYYYDEKKITYIGSCVISIVAYIVGFYFMVYISPTYTTNNYMNALSFLTNKTIVPAVLAVSVLALAVTIIYALLLRNKKVCGLVDIIWKHRALIYKLSVLAVLLFAFINFLVKDRALENIPNAGVIAIAVATGILLLPLCLGKIAVMKNGDIRNRNYLVIYVTFLYGILVYYGALRGYIKYFFYYGRYMVPYLFIAVVMFAVLFKNMKRRYMVIICLAGMLSFVKPLYQLCTNMDDTRLDWMGLEKTLESVQGYNSAVLVAHDAIRAMAMPVASLGCDIYYATDDLEADAEKLLDRYEKIYYVTFSTESVSTDYTVLLRENFVFSMDYQKKVDDISRYPLKYSEEDRTLTVYEYNRRRETYAIAESGFWGTGFGSVERGFAWTNQSTAEVNCFIYPKDYTVTLDMGAKVPLTELGIETYDIAVSVNGEYVETLTVNRENNGGELQFSVTEDMLYDGWNKVTFESRLWSPTDYGSKDSRKMGFAFESMIFTEVDNEL